MEKKGPEIEQELQNLHKTLEGLRKLKVIIDFDEYPQLSSQRSAPKRSEEDANRTHNIQR